MKKTLLILALAAGTNWAAPIAFERIPAAAQWYLHADLEEVQETKVGEELKELVQENAAEELNAVELLFGFESLEDLNSVTIFGKGKQAVVLIQGKFDREHVEGIIGRANEYGSQDYQGGEIHSWDYKEETQYGAFVKDDLVAMSGQIGHLKHALDVQAGRKASMAGKEAEGAPLMMGLANLVEMDIETEDMEILKEAKSLVLRMDEKGDDMVASLAVLTDDKKLAKRMSRMIGGILALVETSIPEFDEYEVESEVDLDEEGTSVLISVSMPSRHMIDFLECLDTLDDGE